MADVSQQSLATTPAGHAPATRHRSTDAERLIIRIQRAIRRDTGDRVRGLTVDVTDKSVLLAGRCGTYYCKQLAQHAAMALAGERTLDNQIEVW